MPHSLKLKRKSFQYFSVALENAEGSVSPWRFVLRSAGRGLGRRGDDLVGQEAARQIPALAKLEKTPKMRAKEMWEQSSISRAFSTDYRGIRIKITVDPETEKPTEISWYLNGKLTESAPVTCSLDIAKKIGTKVIDEKILEDAAWANAEDRHNSDIWKKP